MAGAGELGAPPGEDGLGDEQAMRILMLLARTGRRVSEICMLDYDPLLPLQHAGTSAAGEAKGFVARLRYQQTKIEGAPDTVLVDPEIVAIIRARHRRPGRVVTFHFTPVGSSWLNQIETWFGIITRQAIRRGTFTSVRALIAHITEYIDLEFSQKVKLVEASVRKLTDNNGK
jgi:hypothetical protein